MNISFNSEPPQLWAASEQPQALSEKSKGKWAYFYNIQSLRLENTSEIITSNCWLPRAHPGAQVVLIPYLIRVAFSWVGNAATGLLSFIAAGLLVWNKNAICNVLLLSKVGWMRLSKMSTSQLWPPISLHRLLFPFRIHSCARSRVHCSALEAVDW